MPSRSDNSASSMLPLSRYCSISPLREEYPLVEKSFVIVESDDRTVSSAPFSCSPEHRHSIAIRLREFLNFPFLFLPSILLYHFRPHLQPKLSNNHKHNRRLLSIFWFWWLTTTITSKTSHLMQQQNHAQTLDSKPSPNLAQYTPWWYTNCDMAPVVKKEPRNLYQTQNSHQ